MPPTAPPNAAKAAADPFAPDGIDFRPVSPRLITARLIPNLILDGVVFIGFVIAGVWTSPWWHVGAAAAAICAVWELWLIPRQVRAMGYAMAEDHLLWRKGIMFRRISVIPYGRMQFVDTSQGPLGRYLGIAEVKLHTASATTDATINGLPVAEAENLRQLLSERGEQRMAGL
ncbi:PH domain-containing protein [Actinomyces sp. MRS3W]|uniref:PH domain-containing protein n=1 Tax=Actinomyces sp. MRS3W TaxID=2800796 RepID=UPI0028FD55D9|nr:PH domain-containing protein [Actinomyces sp. MRS3W]MDU0348762.1 PH domain-containing protein [Actinomyces sp. MRS3W]